MRPLQVTAAVWTQFVIAAAVAATGVAALAVNDTVREGTIRRIHSHPDLADFPGRFLDGLLGTGLVGEAITWLVWAVFHVVLGILNYGGRRPARILSWILAGVSLAGCGLGSLRGSIGFRYRLTQFGEDYSDVLNDAIREATPDWVWATEFTALMVLLFGSLAVIILLGWPASNDFFRKGGPLPLPYQYSYLPQSQYPGRPPYGSPAPGPARPPGPEQ